MNGKTHVDYRKGLNSLFTSRALGIYLQIQESIYKQHFAKWVAEDNSTARPFMMQLRDLNMDTSLRVFCGNYIPEHGAKEISEHYWLITVALELVNFPFAFPGTKVYKAIQARKMAMKWFEFTAAESKKRMAAGEEVTCLCDAWVRAMLDARENRENEDLRDDQRKVLHRDFSDREIGMVLLSFLFASQDAMSSGLTYLFQHLADHPEVLRKVREEQYALRNNDVESPLTIDLVEKMEYTRATVRESLRMKPPVIMVPYMTHKPFPISEDYTVPKGAMIIPSFWNSLHEDVEAAAMELARAIAAGPVWAHGITKTQLNQEWNMGLDQAIEAEAQAQAICMKTRDFERAYRAFVKKEQPVFQGD